MEHKAGAGRFNEHWCETGRSKLENTPGFLPEQVNAVQSILAAASAPRDITFSFKGKRAATFHSVIDAIAGRDVVHRLGDGRYAA